VELDALDASSNVLATAVFTGSIAGAPPSSELLQTWDFITADNATLSGSGNITKNGGADIVVPYNVFVQSGSPTTTTDITNAGLRDTLLFFVYFSTITNTTLITNQNFNVSLSNANNSISSTPTRGLFVHVTSSTNVAIRVREYDTSVTTVTERNYGSSFPTSGTALLEMAGSRVFGGFSNSANPARSAVSVGNAGISSAGTSPSASPPATPFAHLQIAPNPRETGEIQLTISKISVFRLAAGAT
jgi:hypothetical protein